MPSRFVGLLKPTFHVVYAAVFLGWWFHRVPEPTLFQYSIPYALFLLVMSAGFLLPTLVTWTLRKLGRRDATFALVATLAGFVLLHVAGSFVYYQGQRHDFDPFLQMPATDFSEVPRTKKPGTFRVATLGGSTTRCVELAPEDRYPARLGQLLERRYPDHEVEVLNAGMDWWTTKHSLINYVTYLRRWEVDLVVVMHAINDAYRSFSPPRFAVGPYDERWSHFYGPSIQGARPVTFEGWLLGRLGRWWYSDLRIRERDTPLDELVSLPMFESHLANLARQARSDGARVLVVTQPSLYKAVMPPAERETLWMSRSLFRRRDDYFHQTYPSPASLERALAAFNATALEVAQASGAASVDAAAAVPRDLEHFVDGVHYTPKGAWALAEIVAGAIDEAPP